MGEMGNAYKILVGNPEEKRPLGRHKYSWEDNIKMDIREIGGKVWTEFIWIRIGTSCTLL
jgi:hypothetical protein